jgi:predicted amidohydrolase
MSCDSTSFNEGTKMSFTIAAAQSQSVKGDIAANVRRHAEFVRVAAALKADVIVFPELSLSGYEPTIAAEVALSPDDPVRRSDPH